MPLTLSNAIAAHQAGDLLEAEHLYRAFLEAHPDHADAYALLGVVRGAAGDFDEAIKLADKAISLDPHAGILHYHKGTILTAAKRLPEALVYFEHALKQLPQTPHIHYNYANALRAAGDWGNAIEHYRLTLQNDPLFLDAYNNLALSLVHEKKYLDALSYIQKAITLDDNYGDGWLSLCNVAEKLKDYDLAVESGKRCTELMPQNHYAWFGYGVALNRVNRDREAVDAYKKALHLNPGRADIWDNLAQTYQSLNWLDEAESTFRKVIEVAGQVIPGEGSRPIDEAEYGNRHWHLALMELLRGKYLEGFARYRSRLNEIQELKRPFFPFPLWKGEDISGKTLLVCDEQGFGDTLMLARFLPLVHAKGARIVCSLHPALIPLFRGWDACDCLLKHGDKVPPCDYFCSFFDLPHLCGITLDSLPQRVPYLPLPPIEPAQHLKSDAPKIGVVWGGSPLHLADHKRSIPLSIFRNLFSLKGLDFYSFNRDLKVGDAELLPMLNIENLAPRLTDFNVAAQLILQMDLVITCDTATAHLAGALGKKLWILLPFAPDWRWLTNRVDSPWYPTATLFRQTTAGDWNNVIAEVKTRLEQPFDRSP
jgi:tetratricopeptide (TPR) repeat protein